MKKKLVSALLVAAMAVTMAAGCGSKEEKSSDKGEKKLKVWGPQLDDATEKNWGGLLKDWEKENDCKVKLTVIPWESYEKSNYYLSQRNVATYYIVYNNCCCNYQINSYFLQYTFETYFA